MSKFIQITKEERIAYVILNDPPKRNALSQEMAAELQFALDSLRFDAEVNIIVLRGAGGFFCAGGDIKSMKKRVDCYRDNVLPETETKANMDRLNRLVLSIRSIEKPVIAWIEGACAGGGMSLAMACDFSIAEERAKMSFAFSSIGLAPDMGSSVLLTSRIGPVRATDLFMTGRRFYADEAEMLGIITKAYPADQLEDEIRHLAVSLSKGPLLSYAVTKRTINQTLYKNLYNLMNEEANNADRLTHSQDHAEAVNAFLEKRKPHFKGC